MAEQKQEKKKFSLVKEIVRWVFCGLLALLLIAALIVQAPGKIAALLIVLLLACAALPRRARKLFWLSTAAVGIVLIIWVFLPEDNEGWRPYTFDEELAALQAKYSVPDEENAALIYDKLFETMNGDQNEPEFFLQSSPSSKDEPWLSKDHPEMAEWLTGHQHKITMLLEAAKKDKCHFPTPSDPWRFGQYTERLPEIRRCAFLLVCAANNDLAEGRVDQAIKKNLTILQMAKHQCQQPMMIDMLVGTAIESLGTEQFNRSVVTGDVTEQRLSIIEQALADIKHEWCSDLPRFLEGEKLLAKNTVCSFAYQRNPQGKSRLSRDPVAVMRAEFPKEFLPLSYWQTKLAKAATVLGWLVMPATAQKAGRIIDECYEKYQSTSEPNFVWQEKLPPRFSMPKSCYQVRFNYRYFANLIADMWIDSLYRARDLYPRLLTENRGSRIIIALRRYKNKTGHWPESLEEVESFAPAEIFVDPTNGSSFVYKLTDDSFTLYSKGKNNIDEAGEYDTGWDADYGGYKVKEDDQLIWPPKSHKTKKENIDAEQQ